MPERVPAPTPDLPAGSSSKKITVPRNFIPENVHAFLEWNPPLLEVLEQPAVAQAATASTSATHNPPTTRSSRLASPTKPLQDSTAGYSKGTRGPAFYDLHLALHLRLNKLRLLPSLVSAMAETVDSSIQKLFADGRQLPTHTGRLFDRKTLDLAQHNSTLSLENEEGVLQHYQLEVSPSAVVIASTLALHPSLDIWDRRIEWTRAPMSELGRHAIADGILKFITPKANASTDVFASLEPDIKALFPDLQRRTLATWEMKSLTVGEKKVMDAIHLKASRKERFVWKQCHGNCKRPDHRNIHATEEEAPRGVDPLHPPWELPVADDDEPPTDMRRSTRLPKHGTPGTPNYHEPSLESQDFGSLGPSTSRKRARDSGLKKRKPLKDADPDHPDVRGGIRYVNSHSFLQQAWAQSVRHNSTIIVLHSGNHEIIGIRHRASQTLYVSEVIEPHNSEPAYGKIQVGLYIAGILETMDRINQERELVQRPLAPQQIDKGRDGGDNGRDGDEKDDGDDDDHVSKRPRLDKSPLSKGPANGGGTRPNTSRGTQKAVSGKVEQAIFKAASSRNIAYIHLFYGIYASPAPAVFIRNEPNLQPVSPPLSLTLNDSDDEAKEDQYTNSVDIILTSEKPPGSTGVVHLGRMNVEPHGIDIPVAAKLGFEVAEKDTLEHEYRIYAHLQSNGVKGIPRCFGLFVYDGAIEDSEGPYALLMGFAGKSLHGRVGNASASAKKSLLSTLKAIHKARVVHGDIRLANLCVNQDGQAFIIDFSHSESSSSRPRMNREIAELCELLDIQDTKAKPPKVANSEVGLRRSARIKEASEKKVQEQRRTAARSRLRK